MLGAMARSGLRSTTTFLPLLVYKKIIFSGEDTTRARRLQYFNVSLTTNSDDPPPSGVIGKSMKFRLKWKWPVMGPK